ncbi:MAG TPA: protein kinase [Kofleriaceae bacterium]|nr:protein kinase [Kofleriaceae bacterium]
MGSDRDDELARTLTATSAAPATPVAAVDSTLGRYKIERELGAGGMGVVHAAFDPDLERRVALKVLRSEGVGAEGRQRLLREARAMARLVHANVVTVHEVGSANGRDYVAMELVEGETLADWLRATPRSEHEILDAFVAAGRGLAAAHAAGVVHRDFKPHNVLRSKSGRIVVTDFGLAREASTDPLAVTLPLQAGASAQAENTPSTPLAGLTMTGSVLGTPAYMAPEQWTGGAVSPATDQFAYCVALWEALAGERPFRGSTIEALRGEIERGPAELDASKIPRRLRPILRRGLDPDPKRRWPSMDALLAAIGKAQRRPAIAMTIVAGGVVAAAALYVVAGRTSSDEQPAAAPIAACPAPKLDPSHVPTLAARPFEARLVTADLGTWNTVRDQTCRLAPEVRVQRLACLDGVLARLEAVATATAKLPAAARPFDIGRMLIDPQVCANAKRVPSLVTSATPAMRDALETAVREASTPGPTKQTVVDELVQRVGGDACAATWAHLLATDVVRTTSERDRHLSEAEQAAERCDDDRERAEVAIVGAKLAADSGFLGTTITAKLKLAEAAVDRAIQPDLVSELDLLRMEIAKRADNLDEAIQRGDAAMQGYARRNRLSAEIDAGIRVLNLREVRGTPDDAAHLRGDPLAWRARALAAVGAQHPIIAKLDREIASRELFAADGDVARSHERLMRLREDVPYAASRMVRGDVVDERGAPVAGATVVAGPRMIGTSASVATPVQNTNLRYATTDASGAFEIADGPEDGIVIAALGDRRSRPSAIGDRVKLVLAPTAHIEGKVELRDTPASQIFIVVRTLGEPLDQHYQLAAPVRSDGSFTLDGAPRAKLRLFATQARASSASIAGQVVDARSGRVDHVTLQLPSQQRTVHVIVRSTVGAPVGNAQVLVMPGVQRSTTAAKLNARIESATTHLARQIELEKAPPSVVRLARPGDLFATIGQVPEGVATACSLGLPTDLSDPELERKLPRNLDKLAVPCVPIPPGADVVVVEVPPFPRLD